jgi:GGDEF domain-containing protein
MIQAVDASPEIRKIFRDEVIVHSQHYREINQASSLADLPPMHRQGLSASDQQLARSDFAAFQNKKKADYQRELEEQIKYRGSIASGATLIGPGEEVAVVINRAEEQMKAVKAPYKQRHGLDTSKYQVDNHQLDGGPRKGPPVALEPVAAGVGPKVAPAASRVRGQSLILDESKLPRKDIMSIGSSRLYEVSLPNRQQVLKYQQQVRGKDGKMHLVLQDVPVDAKTLAVDANSEVGKRVLNDMVNSHAGAGSLVFIDINNLGVTNYFRGGTQTGDRYLTLVGEELRKVLRHEDIIFKNGGDELVVILKSTNPTEVREISQRMINQVDQNPRIREIFRQEVAAKSQKYREINQAHKLNDLPQQHRQSLSPEEISLGSRDFAALKALKKTEYEKAIQEQAKYRGSISTGAALIRADDTLAEVLARAESQMSMAKAEYKVRHGQQVDKYKKGEVEMQGSRKGPPVAPATIR